MSTIRYPHLNYCHTPVNLRTAMMIKAEYEKVWIFFKLAISANLVSKLADSLIVFKNPFFISFTYKPGSTGANLCKFGERLSETFGMTHSKFHICLCFYQWSYQNCKIYVEQSKIWRFCKKHCFNFQFFTTIPPSP